MSPEEWAERMGREGAVVVDDADSGAFVPRRRREEPAPATGEESASGERLESDAAPIDPLSVAREGLVDAHSLEVPRPRFRRRGHKPRQQPGAEHPGSTSSDPNDPLAALRHAIDDDPVPTTTRAQEATSPDDVPAPPTPTQDSLGEATEIREVPAELDLPPELVELAAEAEEPVQIQPRRRGSFTRRDDATATATTGGDQDEPPGPADEDAAVEHLLDDDRNETLGTEPDETTEAGPTGAGWAEPATRTEYGDSTREPDTDQARDGQAEGHSEDSSAGSPATADRANAELPGHQVAYSPLGEIPDPDSHATGARLGPAPVEPHSGLHPDVVAALSLPTTRGLVSRLRRDSSEPTEGTSTPPDASAAGPVLDAEHAAEATEGAPAGTIAEPDHAMGTVDESPALGAQADLAPSTPEDEDDATDEDLADEEPVPAFVEYRSSELPRTGLTVLFVAAVVGAVFAILLSVKDPGVPSVLLAASLVLVSLASWWALLGWSPRVVAIGAGSLEVARGPHSERFDLRDPELDIRTGRDPRSRSWTCEIHRADADPVVIRRGQVHAEEFCRIVRALRSDGPAGS